MLVRERESEVELARLAQDLPKGRCPEILEFVHVEVEGLALHERDLRPPPDGLLYLRDNHGAIKVRGVLAHFLEVYENHLVRVDGLGDLELRMRMPERRRKRGG